MSKDFPVRVVQVVQTYSPYDGTGKIIAQFASVIREMNFKTFVVAEDIRARIPGVPFMDWKRYEKIRDKSDVIIFHFGAFAPLVERVLDLPNPRGLFFHNITPPHYFYDWDSEAATVCAKGYQQLWAISVEFDVIGSPSIYNLSVFEEKLLKQLNVVVVPPYVEILSYPATGLSVEELPLIYVGRRVPHKKVESLIKTVAYLRNGFRIPAVLVFTGWPENTAYDRALTKYATDLGVATSLRFVGSLTETQLQELYRSSPAYVSFSQHEGFGLPLLESIALGVPVIAARHAAVPEVLGKAGVLFNDDQMLDVCKLLMGLYEDKVARQKLGALQATDVLDRYNRTRTAGGLRELLSHLAVY